MSDVTPRMVEDARRKAMDLMDVAYAPHDVPQPDGSTLALCLQGRLDRAYRLMGEADRAGDRALLERYAAATRALSAQVKEWSAKATAAAAKYTELALAAGMPADNLPPPPCTCEGCQIRVKQAEFFEAVAALRTAVFALLTPKDVDDTLPVLASLVSEGASDAVAKHVQRIAEAQQRYAAACTAFERSPNWERVLC